MSGYMDCNNNGLFTDNSDIVVDLVDATFEIYAYDGTLNPFNGGDPVGGGEVFRTPN